MRAIKANKLFIAIFRTIIAALRAISKNYIYAIKNGLARGLKRKGGLGYFPQIRSLSPEQKWLLNFDFSNYTICDIGGHEGVFTLFFARAVGDIGKVITFEPHPENYQKICENVGLNKFDNVVVRQTALGKIKGNGILVSRPEDYGTASLHAEIKDQILGEKGAKTFSVPIDTLDNQIVENHLPKPNFVKIDVEGLEHEVLQGMSETIKQCKPKLFIEIHDIYIKNTMGNVKFITDFLIERGYSIYHIESNNLITKIDQHMVKEGHFYCE
jgi:FkbM family methyltransferase